MKRAVMAALSLWAALVVWSIRREYRDAFKTDHKGR